MQVPYRKPGKYSQIKQDPLMSQEKFDELEKKLKRLKLNTQPHAAKEVARLAELGDFSENAEYQLAKGKLRGINNAILKLDHQIHTAIIIQPKSSDEVQIGHSVTVQTGGKEKIFHILGSQETDPQKNIISHSSPLGTALLGKKIGDTISIELPAGSTEYTIVNIQ